MKCHKNTVTMQNKKKDLFYVRHYVTLKLNRGNRKNEWNAREW